MTPVPSLLDLARLHTGRAPRSYSRDALVTVSHEIEDRYGIQRRVAPLLFGGFQRARFLAHDRTRWERFGGSAAVAVAAFGGKGHASSSAHLSVIRVGEDDAFWRDWLCLAYAGERRSGMVIARDLDGDPDAPAARRRCVGFVSHDHKVVHAAAVWVGAYLASHDATLAARWRRELAEVPVGMPPRRRRTRA